MRVTFVAGEPADVDDDGLEDATWNAGRRIPEVYPDDDPEKEEDKEASVGQNGQVGQQGGRACHGGWNGQSFVSHDLS